MPFINFGLVKVGGGGGGREVKRGGSAPLSPFKGNAVHAVSITCACSLLYMYIVNRDYMGSTVVLLSMAALLAHSLTPRGIPIILRVNAAPHLHHVSR